MSPDLERDPAHRRIAELLPWFVNRTLEQREAEEVERHVAQCQACRAQIAMLRAVQDAAAADYLATPAPDAERALAAVQARLAREAQARPRPTGLFERWQRFWSELAPVGRFVMAGQAAAIAVLAATTLVLVLRSAPQEYETAAARARPQGAGPSITIAFQETAREGDVRALLVELDARVVAGPSAAGFYSLAIAPRPGETAAAAVQDRLARLRARSDLVRFAEIGP
jgi:anti-sigma factor RsiW